MEHNISEEQDPEIKLKLRRFQKGLKAAHDSVARARDVFAMFLSAKEADHESLVAGNFSELTGEFFEYIQHKVGASAAAADAAKAKWSAEELKESADEREHWVSLGTRIAALASSFEKAQQDDDALAGAAERFQDLLQVCAPLHSAIDERREKAFGSSPAPETHTTLSSVRVVAARPASRALCASQWHSVDAAEQAGACEQRTVVVRVCSIASPPCNWSCAAGGQHERGRDKD